MLVAKPNPPNVYGKQLERERDPFAPAVPTEPFALIHAALSYSWDQLRSAQGAGNNVASAFSDPSRIGGTWWPALPEHTSLYSPKSTAFMASWLNANTAAKVPLKGLINMLLCCWSNVVSQIFQGI